MSPAEIVFSEGASDHPMGRPLSGAWMLGRRPEARLAARPRRDSIARMRGHGVEGTSTERGPLLLQAQCGMGQL